LIHKSFDKALDIAVKKFQADKQDMKAFLDVIESEVSKLELEVLGNNANEDSL
jgi:hypothetical protein